MLSTSASGNARTFALKTKSRSHGIAKPLVSRTRSTSMVRSSWRSRRSDSSSSSPSSSRNSSPTLKGLSKPFVCDSFNLLPSRLGVFCGTRINRQEIHRDSTGCVPLSVHSALSTPPKEALRASSLPLGSDSYCGRTPCARGVPTA